MTKREIAVNIAEEMGVTQVVAMKMIDLFTNNVKEACKSGEGVYIRGFGTFAPKTRKARLGRNISKREAVSIPSRVEPTFKPCKLFKKEVNNGR